MVNFSRPLIISGSGSQDTGKEVSNMRANPCLRHVRFSALMMAGWFWLTGQVLLGQAEKAEEGLDPSEVEAVQKAKNPEEKLRVCLSISNERIKAVASATRKENAEELVKAVGGFRAALNQAEDLLAQQSPTSSTYRKMADTLLRTARKHSATLLEILKNAQEDLRKYILSALEVTERIVDSLALQLEKTSKK